MEANKYIKEEKIDLPEEIIKNPHKFIKEWAEMNLINVGKRVFELVALQPCSLILPNIKFNSQDIRTSFNTIFIAPPSAGKTTLCNKFGQISYHHYPVKKVTAYQLALDLTKQEMFTLTMDDFSQIGNDYDVVKVLEQAIGDDQRVIWKNKNININKQTRGIGMLGGTWKDLARYIKYFESGLLFRSNLIMLDLTYQEKEEIANYINSSIGNAQASKETFQKENVVKKYYDYLYGIQAGESKIPPIKGVHFDEVMKKRILKIWKHFQTNNANSRFEFNRELHEGYRFAYASAFLNVFNRKVEDGIIYPTSEDFDLSVKLMKEIINNKLAIIKSQEFLNQNPSIEIIKQALQNPEIPIRTKKIIYNLRSYSGEVDRG